MAFFKAEGRHIPLLPAQLARPSCLPLAPSLSPGSSPTPAQELSSPTDKTRLWFHPGGWGWQRLRPSRPCQGPRGCARQQEAAKQKAGSPHPSPRAEESQAALPCSLLPMEKTQNSQGKCLWLASLFFWGQSTVVGTCDHCHQCHLLLVQTPRFGCSGLALPSLGIWP